MNASTNGEHEKISSKSFSGMATISSSVTAKRSDFLKGGRSIWLNDVEESLDAADEALIWVVTLTTSLSTPLKWLFFWK